MSAAARARALADVGRLDQAERAVRDGLAGTPSDPELLGLLAGLRRLQGDSGAALEFADAAVAVAPGQAFVHIERAECLLVLARPAEALESASEAVRLSPDRPEPHRSLARCLTLLRRHDAARDAAGRAVTLAPHSVEDLMTLAEVERHAGRGDAARAATVRALAENPDHTDGRWMMAVLDAQRLRIGEAMRGLRGLAADHPGRYGAPVLSWPVRGLLASLTVGLSAGLPVVALLAAGGHRWASALLLARGSAAVIVLVAVTMAIRVLIPAGRLPWISLRLLPAATRRAVVVRLVAAGAALALLLRYAVSPAWPVLASVLAVQLVMLAAGRVERR
ncbi:tetratricopeptide repeat protein [Actinoplanes sp. NPDC023801]|uniref:tetratricopeptide repeat protein n=1 Tax=Actinoplanes sp. NPDC023801 TaxID=3154595 RepID=UPI0033FEDE15